jgi:hypothetical protein
MPAFFEKMGDSLKNLGNRASDSIEISKLNGKIKAEKAAIAELQGQIGAYYYRRHEAGQAGDPGAAEWIAAIDSHNAAVAELQAEIARIQAEAETPAPEAPQGAPAALCAQCGQGNPPGTKFCGACGVRCE